MLSLSAACIGKALPDLHFQNSSSSSRKGRAGSQGRNRSWDHLLLNVSSTSTGELAHSQSSAETMKEAARCPLPAACCLLPAAPLPAARCPAAHCPTARCLACRFMLSWLSYTGQDHLTRNGGSRSGPSSPISTNNQGTSGRHPHRLI